MKKFKYILLLYFFVSLVSCYLRSSIVVNVVNSKNIPKHHFDYHYRDNNSQVIFSHSHNNNVNHYQSNENGLHDITVSGEMSNIAPSASKFVSPEITQKKVQINSEIYHQPKLVSQPTLLGYNQQVHEINGFEHFSGQVIHKNIVVNTPEIGVTHQVIYFLFRFNILLLIDKIYLI